jgi:uncharacterized protein
MPFVSSHKDGRVLLRVYVQPGASSNKILGLHDNAMKLAVTAPPVDGKANTAVIKFLAAFLNVKKKDLEIKHGLQSRKKSILVAGLNVEEIRLKIQDVIV